MKTKKNIYGLISLFLITAFLFSISSVLAVGNLAAANITVAKIASSSVVSGLTEYNCTIPILYTDQNYTRSRAYLYSSALTANTSQNYVTSYQKNFSAVQLNSTIETRALEDATDYIFICELWNGTTKINSTATTGITIDNTEPATPSSLSPASNSIDTDGSVTFSATVQGNATTSCTLYFPGTQPSSASSYSMTHTGNTCTYTLTSIPDQSYDYYIRASDESNTTDSSVTRFNVNRESASSWMFNTPQSENAQTNKAYAITSGDNETTIGAIIIIVMLIGILYYAFK